LETGGIPALEVSVVEIIVRMDKVVFVDFGVLEGSIVKVGKGVRETVGLPVGFDVRTVVVKGVSVNTVETIGVGLEHPTAPISTRVKEKSCLCMAN
jgi:hypothetical protein